MFQEKLWIYFNGKKPLNIRKIDSLSSVNKLRIGFTSKTGYSYNFFKTVLKFLNIDRTRLIESENNYNSLISSFQNNEIDAVVSFSLPLMAFDTLPQSQKMFLSKDDAFLIEKRVHNVFASTINNTINQYSLGSWSFLIGTKKSISTFQTEKLLVSSLINNSTEQNSPTQTLIKASYNRFITNKNHEDIQLRNLPLFSELQSNIGLQAINWQPYYLSLLFIFILLIANYFYTGKVLPKFNLLFLWHRYKHFQFGFILLIIIYFSSVELLVFSEKIFYQDIGIKSQILNMSRRDLHSWLMVTTVTGNSNGIFPISLMGKGMLALNSLNFWIGTILIGVSEFITYKANKKRKQGLMETKHSHHIVISGWNTSTEQLITETISDAKNYNNTKINIVSIVPNVEEVRNTYQIIKELHDQKALDIIEGDARDYHILELARVEKAHAVILLSEDNSKLSDERTAIRAHAISRYTKKKKNNGKIYKTTLIEGIKEKLHGLSRTNKNDTVDHKRYGISSNADTVYMIAEINNEEFRESLIDADVNEIIITGNYRKGIIKQSLFNHGISTVLDEIMQYNEYNEFYKIDLSKKENKQLRGKTFDELLPALRKQGILLMGIHIVFHDKENNVIIDKSIIRQLLDEEEKGITRDILVNPIIESERNRKVDEDDHLIVLATNMKLLRKGVKEVIFS